MRDGLVVEQRFAFTVASRGEAQVAFVIFEKNVTALGARQAQRHLEHSHQDFIEHTCGVQLARGFQR